ncbi:MAG: ECF-type sigma factor [Acidobacteriota bacterium]
MTPENSEITGLLRAWSGGESAALDRLLPLVFDDLHRMARFFFQRESDTHTLQPTALVSEVYFRLRGQKEVELENRKDFFNFSADVMRHFLVDYARKRNASKRGGGTGDLPLDTGIASLLSSTPSSAQILDLNAALEELEEVDPRQARVVMLRYFLGLQVAEIAELLEISESTVKRDWRTARYWLKKRLVESKKKVEPTDP